MQVESTKILIVEDEEAIRTSLVMLLEDIGYIVQEAENGKEALDAIPDFQPHVILTDLNMPVMGGIELLEQIDNTQLKIPVIIFSGKTSADETIQALKLGAYDYIRKPLGDISFLTHAINKAIEKQELINLATNYQELFEKGLKEKTYELNQQINLLQQAEQQILQAKQEWENTIDSIQEIVALYDKNHQLIRYNSSLSEIYPLSDDNNNGEITCLFLNNCTNENNCPHSRVIKSGIPETILHEHNATGRTFEAQVLPYKINQKVTGTILVAKDITAIKAAQNEQERLQTRLLQAQKLESVGQLASGIAHEINTPTQYVSSNLDFLNEAYDEISELLNQITDCVEQGSDSTSEKISKLIEEADLDYLREEVPSAIKQSSEGANRIRSIVLAMKEFSHPGSKQKEPADINKIITTTITVARNEWKYVSNVTTDLDPDLPAVNCLTDEVGQVILNLLVNAAQAIGEKLGRTPTGDKGAIHISTVQKNKQVIISINDNGPGIPKEIIDKVFDPFFTTKEVGKGTGQGLAIAHDVIYEKHGGTMEVTSNRDKGTTFTISLPIT